MTICSFDTITAVLLIQATHKNNKKNKDFGQLSRNWCCPFLFFTDSSIRKPSLISSLDCLSSIVERISTDPAVAPPGDSVVPRGPGSPQSSPAGSSSSAEPNSIYEPLWTRWSRGLLFHKKPGQTLFFLKLESVFSLLNKLKSAAVCDIHQQNNRTFSWWISAAEIW